MSFKLRNTTLSYKEIGDCYNAIISNSFSDEGFYDPLIHIISEGVAFLATFAEDGEKIFEEIEDAPSYILATEPMKLIDESDLDLEIKNKLVSQWLKIRSAADSAISELNKQEQRKTENEFFAVLTETMKSFNTAIDKVDVEQLNKNIKSMTVENVIKQYNASEDKQNIDRDNIIPIK